MPNFKPAKRHTTAQRVDDRGTGLFRSISSPIAKYGRYGMRNPRNDTRQDGHHLLGRNLHGDSLTITYLIALIGPAMTIMVVLDTEVRRALGFSEGFCVDAKVGMEDRQG